MLDDDEIITQAAEVVDEARVGAVATVDEDGRPQSRFMAAVRENEKLQHLFSLTATETRKVHQIRANANICWLFADRDYERVVKLSGEAEFATTSDLPMDAWNRLVEYADAYVTGELRDKKHYAFWVLVTRVYSVELLAPKLGLVTPHVVEISHG